jgi:hypothetical protein
LPLSNGIVVAVHVPFETVVDSLRAPELEHGPEDADDHGLLRPREAGSRLPLRDGGQVCYIRGDRRGLITRRNGGGLLPGPNIGGDLDDICIG